MTAEMTFQRLIGAVISHRHTAMRTLFHVPTFSALHTRGIAAAINKKNNLLLALETPVHVVNE